jgi:DNA replication initiation complex subunit (GINS family)
MANKEEILKLIGDVRGILERLTLIVEDGEDAPRKKPKDTDKKKKEDEPDEKKKKKKESSDKEDEPDDKKKKKSEVVVLYTTGADGARFHAKEDCGYLKKSNKVSEVKKTQAWVNANSGLLCTKCGTADE